MSESKDWALAGSIRETRTLLGQESGGGFEEIRR